jgi:hypothetical protein
MPKNQASSSKTASKKTQGKEASKTGNPMTTAKKGNPHGHPPCTARKKASQGGGPCERYAGWGTDHAGQGPCKYHGGLTPVKHGRYSQITRPRLKQLIEQFEAESDPMDMLPELALLRALVTDYIERYDVFTGALLAWHDSYIDKDKTPNPKPQQVLDIISAGGFIAQIAKVTERIQKQKQEGTVTLEAVNAYVETLGMEVFEAAQEAIPDAAARTSLLAALDRRWQSVSFNVKPRPARPTEGDGAS